MATPNEQPAEQFEFDVFISYSSKDKDWVRGELLTRIEDAGLKAFIDFRDFTRGALSINECERGVEICRNTVMVLTPHYFQSGWTEIENAIAQSADPSNRKLRLIPLLKEACESPRRIAALTYIDFQAGADHALAWRQLLTALGKPPEQPQPETPPREGWLLPHPYPMPPNFTGRAAERGMLNRWLGADAEHPLLVLRALGGFGKSALAWHWLTHDVTEAAWPRVAWWSFYEGDASFDHFLAETLHYLTGGKHKTERPSSDDLAALLSMLQLPGTLLVLDGFERVLRAFGGMDAAYQGDEGRSQPPAGKAGGKATGQTDGSDRDCISQLAADFLYNLALQPRLRSKVLLTTRLTPRVLEARGGGFLIGCREQELRRMQSADAVAFFVAQGVRGTRAEIEAACERYGYHPLSLRLLAGLIVRDLKQPGDVAVATRLDVSGDTKQRQHHVLEAAYDGLAPQRRKLLSRIACFRGPVDYDALRAVSEDPNAFDADVQELAARGLLYRDPQDNRFDLHPIVRRYAYDRLADADRAAAHVQLRDYFEAVPEPDRVTRLADLAAVIELYHHTVRAGRLDDARVLYRDRLSDALYFRLGAYQLIIELLGGLFPDGEDRPPRLKDERAQAWTLAELSNSYSLSGQPRRAVPLFERHNAFYEKQGDKLNLAIGLGNVADDQLKVGSLRTAEANLRRSIALCREIENESKEATGHQELGRLLACRGAYAESKNELVLSTAHWVLIGDVQGQCMDQAYNALRELLQLRSSESTARRDQQSALAPARRALELADEKARTHRPNARDYVRAHWLLGAAHRVASPVSTTTPSATCTRRSNAADESTASRPKPTS